jgi:NADH-quinone oxidoreductase subunit F
MLYNQPNPLEVRVLSRRFGLPNSQSIETYLANDGYKALEKALGMTQDSRSSTK